MKSLIVGIGVLATAAACVDKTESFTPTERPTGVTPEGYTAAEYQIVTELGALGDVKVYTAGARRVVDGGRPSTVLEVSFQIENNSDRALVLDHVMLDSVNVGRRMREDVPPSNISGPTEIAPGEEAEVLATFEFADLTDPEALDAFRIRWQLRADGTTYAQRTPFIEREEEYYYLPYYDPFFYPAPDPFFHGHIVVHRRPFRHTHRL